jgi:hypothetical protein
MDRNEQASRLIIFLGTLVVEFQKLEMFIDSICRGLISEDSDLSMTLISGRNFSDKLNLINPLFELKCKNPEYIFIMKKFITKCLQIADERNKYIHSNYIITKYKKDVHSFKVKKYCKDYKSEKIDTEKFIEYLDELEKVTKESMEILIDIVCINKKKEITFFLKKARLLTKEELAKIRLMKQT